MFIYIVCVGENIELRYPPALAEAHDGLMASSGHRANMQSPDHNEIGIGIRVVEYFGYDNAAIYTQDFGLSDSGAASLQATVSGPVQNVVTLYDK